MGKGFFRELITGFITQKSKTFSVCVCLCQVFRFLLRFPPPPPFDKALPVVIFALMVVVVVVLRVTGDETLFGVEFWVAGVRGSVLEALFCPGLEVVLLPSEVLSLRWGVEAEEGFPVRFEDWSEGGATGTPARATSWPGWTKTPCRSGQVK